MVNAGSGGAEEMGEEEVFDEGMWRGKGTPSPPWALPYGTCARPLLLRPLGGSQPAPVSARLPHLPSPCTVPVASAFPISDFPP